ncbi:uncharacterized protein LOC122011265 [Zingiber officinale]|uniref:uncharacterized protein LOC122011265 n=1 Tax=Zingiber officinale TaxID=94328 RepID=UPI001C4AD7A4|nr:uncharacterized protein LOC122011265 [Zingiber officinale]
MLKKLKISFHRRHSAGKFFKERRYLLKEFPELIRISDPVKVLKVGCGNGSTVLPILRAKQNITVYASTGSAISLVPRFFTFLLDVSVNDFPDWLFYTSCRRNSSPESANFSSDSRGENLEMSHMSAFLREDQCCIGGVDFVTMKHICYQQFLRLIDCLHHCKRNNTDLEHWGPFLHSLLAE